MFMAGMGLSIDVFEHLQIMVNINTLHDRDFADVADYGDSLISFLRGVITWIDHPELMGDIVSAGKENMTLVQYREYKDRKIGKMTEVLNWTMIGDLCKLIGTYV